MTEREGLQSLETASHFPRVPARPLLLSVARRDPRARAADANRTASGAGNQTGNLTLIRFVCRPKIDRLLSNPDEL